MSCLSLPVLLVIRLYQTTVAPLATTRRCRLTPSCSEYAYQVIARHGLLLGMRLARERLARCNPDHPGGWDPAP